MFTYIFSVTGAVVKLPLVDTISCSYQKGWQANGMQINADTSKKLTLMSTRSSFHRHYFGKYTVQLQEPTF